jgi:hypothetical protein
MVLGGPCGGFSLFRGSGDPGVAPRELRRPVLARRGPRPVDRVCAGRRHRARDRRPRGRGRRGSLGSCRFVACTSRRTGRTRIARPITTTSSIGYDEPARSVNYYLIARSIRQEIDSVPTRTALRFTLFTLAPTASARAAKGGSPTLADSADVTDARSAPARMLKSVRSDGGRP